MLATKVHHSVSSISAVSSRPPLVLTLALDGEHRQSVEFETTGRVADDPGVPVERICARPLSAEERPVTAKARSFAPGGAVVHRYAQGKGSVEETVLEIYYGNLSVAEAAEIAHALWGPMASLAVVVESARQVTDRLQAWLERPLAAPHRYVWLHAVDVKQKIKGQGKLTRLGVAVGLGGTGQRQVLAVGQLGDDAPTAWVQLLDQLRARGLRGADLFIGEHDANTAKAVADSFPAARYQGCLVHLENEVLVRVPPAKIDFVWQAFKAIREGTSAAAARAHVDQLQRALRTEGWAEAAAVLERTALMQFNYFSQPSAHWSRLRDLDPLRRAMREFRETIRQIGPVKDPATLVLLAAARLRWISRVHWARRPF